MSRRRALIGQVNGDKSIVFEETNYTVTSGHGHVNTGVKFLSSDFSGTVLLDVDISANPTTSSDQGYQYRLFDMWETGDISHLTIGKNKTSATDLTKKWQNSGWTIMFNCKATAGRKRYCLTHVANSTYLGIQFKEDSGTLRNSDTSATSFTPTEVTLRIGSTSFAQALPVNSIVRHVTVYNRVLSQSEIDAFFT